ncbi:MAG: NADH-ubiquinone oxidoreductase-F iron-sulfur binding region domain-containing protein, partial [Isosphaeraceae bacterium]
IGAGMVVYAEGTDIFDQALNSSEFFRNESCGKCVPCRLGSQKMVDLATGLAAGEYKGDALGKLEQTVQQLQRTMELTSICGLGAVAANPVASILRYFPEEFRRRSSSPNGRPASSVETSR